MMIDRVDMPWLKRLLDSDYGYRGFLLARTNVIEATNVYEMSASVGLVNDGLWPDVDLAAFPNVAPPFDSYWIEWQPSSGATFKNSVFSYAVGVAPVQIGVWCAINDRTTEDRFSIMVAVFAGERNPKIIARTMLQVNTDGTGLVEAEPLEVFLDKSNQPLSEDTARMAYELEALLRKAPTEELRAKVQGLARLARELEAANDEEQQAYAKLAQHWCRVHVYPTLLMTHSLLACRNVSTEEHRTPAKIQKARVRRGRLPKVTYKTLTVDVMGRARNASSASEPRMSLGDGQTAMHLMRGHFKTFTEDRPLFGKYTGTWWWSPFVRGNPEHGTIVKDYQVG